MDNLLKKILKQIVELKEKSQANNDLLGFLCSKIAPSKKIHEKDITVSEMMMISMEMSEIFEKYGVTPDEYGIS